MHIKKGDQVKILVGKDRGKTGRVLRVFPDEMRVLVEGLNIFKKRVRPKRQGQKGELVSIPRPLHISNVQLICSSCKKASRIGFRLDGVKKERYCKKCGATT